MSAITARAFGHTVGLVMSSSSLFFFFFKITTLSYLTTFYSETGLAEKGRAVDIFYLDFSKDFDTVSHKTLTEKVMKCSLISQ